ncbi:MAG TPA: hypothetical protein VMV57_05665 [Terracidiphilus sp.]|nr:hypothetical protein [Terracidiphilus sp.]
MTEQLENRADKKQTDKTDLDAAAQKRISRLAETAAEKASKTEQHYDKDHTIISK